MEFKIVKETNNLRETIDFLTCAIREYELTNKDWSEGRIKYNMVKSLNKFLGNSIAGGCNGTVYEYNGFIIKHLTGAPCYTKDGKMLEMLNGSPYFPTVYAYNDKYMIAEKINGVTVYEYEYENKDANVMISPLFNHYLEKAFEHAESRNVILSDLTKKNVMINQDGLPVIIDAGTFNTKWDNDTFNFGKVNYCRMWADDFVKNNSNNNRSTITAPRETLFIGFA